MRRRGNVQWTPALARSRVDVFPLLGPFVAIGAPIARARGRRVRLVGLLGLGEGASDIRPLLALLDPLEDVEVLEVLVADEDSTRWRVVRRPDLSRYWQ